MKKKRTIKFNIYLDRQGNAKLRKGKYRLDDGELRIGLTVFVPEQFFKTFSFETDSSIVVKEQEISSLESAMTIYPQ